MPPFPIDPVALLAAIVQSSDDAICSKDLDGTITTWNQAAERMFGYSEAEAVGRSIRMIIPAGREHEEDEVLSRIRRGETVDHFETVRRRKDGTFVPISLSVSPIRGADGTLIGASKIARDISERMRVEAALAEAQAAQEDLQRRLLALVAASSTLLRSPRASDVLTAILRLARELVTADAHAVWRLDTVSGRWVIGARAGVSDAFAGSIISSHHGAGVTTLPFTEPLIAEDVHALPMLDERREVYDREGIRSLLSVPLLIRAQVSGTLVFYYRTRHQFSEVEVQIARALGNLSAAAITTAELYDDQQHSHDQASFLARAGTVLASSLDYQATLRAVAQLAVPHIADWCAVDLAHDNGSIERLAVAHVDPVKVEVARKFQERYPDDPSSPYSVSHVIRTGVPAVLYEITDEMIVSAARDEEHLRALRALDVRSLMCVPLLAHGRTLGAVTFVSAGSGRHYASPDLRFAEDVASRGALAVENARAYDEARRANRIKDDFLATLSHELRTPLNAILGYARMLRTGMLTGEKQARGLEIVERSATSLTQIVEDVLDVSRIISGKIRLNVQPVELPAIISEAVAAVLPAADAKGIRVQTEVDPQVRPVSGDAERLQQVVWNLMSNAVKFTPPGGRVDVRVQASGAHVELVVSDTGIGFPPEFAPHAFERFRQADSGFAREHGGLGLGLAIARHLVELHGGTIHADSAGQDQGATFRVRLAAMAAPRGPADADAERRAGAARAGLADLRGIHVLAVDDDAVALTLVCEILEAAGARVTTASAANTALDQIGRVRPDVLIADLGMPLVDGFELIARVRAASDAAVRDTPAAALTAYARSEDRAKALRHGFQMHLAKPIDPADLVAAVAALARHGHTPTV